MLNILGGFFALLIFMMPILLCEPICRKQIKLLVCYFRFFSRFFFFFFPRVTLFNVSFDQRDSWRKFKYLLRLNICDYRDYVCMCKKKREQTFLRTKKILTNTIMHSFHAPINSPQSFCFLSEMKWREKQNHNKYPNVTLVSISWDEMTRDQTVACVYCENCLHNS